MRCDLNRAVLLGTGAFARLVGRRGLRITGRTAGLSRVGRLQGDTQLIKRKGLAQRRPFEPEAIRTNLISIWKSRESGTWLMSVRRLQTLKSQSRHPTYLESR